MKYECPYCHRYATFRDTPARGGIPTKACDVCGIVITEDELKSKNLAPLINGLQLWIQNLEKRVKKLEEGRQTA